MNLTKKMLLIAGVALISTYTTESIAQDRTSLSSRAGAGANVNSARRPAPFHRVDDKGRPLVLWSNQVVYRHRNDTMVNRNEGRATARDEETSQAVMFHVKPGKGVRPGHVYANRGN